MCDHHHGGILVVRMDYEFRGHEVCPRLGREPSDHFHTAVGPFGIDKPLTLKVVIQMDFIPAFFGQ